MDVRGLFTKPNPHDPQNRNLYISLGGTGLDALQAVKRRTMDLAGCQTEEEAILGVRFLALDADPHRFESERRGVIQEAECFYMDAQILRRMPRNLLETYAESCGVDLAHYAPPVMAAGCRANADTGALLLASYRMQLSERFHEILFHLGDPITPVFVHLFFGVGGGMSGAVKQMLEVLAEAAESCGRTIFLCSYAISEAWIVRQAHLTQPQRQMLQNNRRRVFAQLKERYTAELLSPMLSADFCHLIGPGNQSDEMLASLAVYAGEFLYQTEHQIRFNYDSLPTESGRFAAIGAKAIHNPRKELMAQLAVRTLEQENAQENHAEVLEKIKEKLSFIQKQCDSIVDVRLEDLGFHLSDVRRLGTTEVNAQYQQLLGRQLTVMHQKTEQFDQQLRVRVFDTFRELAGNPQFGPKAVSEFLKVQWVPYSNDLLNTMTQQLNRTQEMCCRHEAEWKRRENEIIRRNPPVLFAGPLYEQFLYEMDTFYQMRYRFETLYRIRAIFMDLRGAVYQTLTGLYAETDRKLRQFYGDAKWYVDHQFDGLYAPWESENLITSYLEQNQVIARYRNLVSAFRDAQDPYVLSSALRSACQLSAHNREEVLQIVFEADEFHLQQKIAQRMQRMLTEPFAMLADETKLYDIGVYYLNAPAEGVFSEAVHALTTPIGPYYAERAVSDDICLYKLSSVRAEGLADWE